MSKAAIKVDRVSKMFRLYDNPKDRLKEALHPFRRQYHKQFRALDNVSFEVRKGETVGIIGRNGSGKSTILQIICGVLRPTEGVVNVDGRIAALLELGAGFNPEYTGRENVYMNSSIMGLSRDETDERFDAIAGFADIGDFIDQPVKHYSSGMYVRLAFAVAIHVEPDILIVDEALAVGDEAFQRKSYSRLRLMQERQCTILFVSHSASRVVELCREAILLERGKMIMRGVPKMVVAHYHKLLYTSDDKIEGLLDEMEDEPSSVAPQSSGLDLPLSLQRDWSYKPGYDGSLIPQSTISYESRGAVISSPQITTLSGDSVNVLVHGEEYEYSFVVAFAEEACHVRFGMLFKTTSGFELGGISSHKSGSGMEKIPRGTQLKLKFRFKCLFLPGVYFMNSGVLGFVNQLEVFLHRVIDIYMFRVEPGAEFSGNGIVDFVSGGKSPEIIQLYQESQAQ